MPRFGFAKFASFTRQLRDRFGRRPAEKFDPELAREILQLIGRAYVFYFEQKTGASPAAWPPQARRKYERYADPEALPDFPRGVQLERRITWSPGGANSGRSYAIGFLARRGRTHYLIFRGTAAEREWWKDFQLVQKPLPFDLDGQDPGQVHLGFLKIFETLDPAPEALARSIKGPLVIGGHSLGAALATLCALELYRLRPTLYTLASPRIGDPRFAATFARLVPRAYRIYNFWDPIVKQPDADTDLFFKNYQYRHVGKERMIYSLSQTGGESIPQLVGTGLDLASYVLDGGHFDPLFAHQLKTYEHGLRKL